MAPAATRGAVSRALARSSVSRQSVVSHLMLPARSACPGRGRWTGGVFSRSSILESRLTIWMVSGLPMVVDRRTPERNSAWSDSIFCRAPRPYPPWRRDNSVLMNSVSRVRPAGRPVMVASIAGPCDSPAVWRLSFDVLRGMVVTMCGRKGNRKLV